MYVCGVTVYDYCHVGHARCYVAFDIMQRWLRHRGFEVTYVRNITDIDDKIIRRAAENGEPIERAHGALHPRDARGFRGARRSSRPITSRAPPQHIPAIIALIERLIERGFAYVGGQRRRALCGREVSRATASCRASAWRICAPARGSRSTRPSAIRLDFVLWKRAKPGEPAWPSPWGAGRPGWHIECSAMASALLGTHFDLHGGGMDLKFPHHENEIAQSCAAQRRPFVNVWVHNGFVNIDDEKMSKSLRQFLHGARGAAASAPSRGAAGVPAVESLPRSDQLHRRAAAAGRCRADPAVYRAARSASRQQPRAPGSAAGGRTAPAASALGAHRRASRPRSTMTSIRPRRSRCCRALRASSTRRAPAVFLQTSEVMTLAGELRFQAAAPGAAARGDPSSGSGSPPRAASPLGRPRAARRATEEVLDEARIEALIRARLAARAARDFKTADRIRAELEAGR